MGVGEKTLTQGDFGVHSEVEALTKGQWVGEKKKKTLIILKEILRGQAKNSGRYNWLFNYTRV